MDELFREGLHSIGALSKIVKISTDTLRYYDEIELVKPAFISEQTAYRYYSDSQVMTIARVLELKEYGFSLAEIKEMLKDDEEPLIDIYKKRYSKLLREKQRAQEVIDKLALKIKQIQEGMYMNKSILLVDDAAFMRMLCKDVLGKHGYNVVGEAANGAEAAEKYKNLLPDLVLLDIAMPEMDGIAALKKIKDINNDVKIIMCSALGQPCMVIEALLSGATDFIVKPFRSERLVEAVNGAFDGEREFDKETLKKMLDKYGDNTKILMQAEIDEIIKNALDGDASAVFIDEVSKPAENSIEDENDIYDMLKKIIKGQDEIKELMTQILGRNDTKQ